MLVRTDGGATLISGEKKLRTCIKKWNRQRIREYLLRKRSSLVFDHTHTHTPKQRRTTVVFGNGV